MKRFNSQGFTFVEMMISFSIFLIVVSFLPLSVSLLYQNIFMEDRVQKMEWEVFIAQVKKEIRMSDDVSVVSNKLTLLSNKQSIVYERYGTKIRRRVDKMGHEVMLQDIQSVTFELVVNGVRISVLDKYGQQNSAIIRQIVNEAILDVP